MRFALMTFMCFCFIMSTSLGEAAEQRYDKGMDMQAMMEAYQKLSISGAPHEQLASLEGSWATQTKEWMEPGKHPRQSTGSCEMKMLKIMEIRKQ
ncbi:MAG: hypothetical protein NPIRA02_35320 [Nitrospirales bacterium]|nr:MAG: hypothetical protein NPIRA02_35320 [Nitrospirales bacterium]